MAAHALLLGHAHEDVDALLKLLGAVGGVAQQKQREDDVARHVVETAAKEVVLVLVGVSLHLLHSLSVEVDAFGNAVLQRFEALCGLIGQQLLHDVEVGAVGDVADGSDHLQLRRTLVDGEDTGIAQQTLCLVLHNEAGAAMHAHAVVGVLVGKL